MTNILILNGPNLNMLGVREPAIYGTQTLADLSALCEKKADELGLSVTCQQSNHEGELVTAIQDAGKHYSGIIINGGAYTHTSVAIMDALLTLKIPVIEVHLSNPLAREEFRHISYLGRAATGTISGFGADSYLLALDAMKKVLA